MTVGIQSQIVLQALGKVAPQYLQKKLEKGFKGPDRDGQNTQEQHLVKWFKNTEVCQE